MEENKSLKYAKEIDEICKTFENEKEEEKCKSNFRDLYEKIYKALPTSKWDEFKEYCYKDERFRDGYAKSYGEERFNERFIKVFGRIASKEYVKEIEEICNAYEKTTNDDLRVIALKTPTVKFTSLFIIQNGMSLRNIVIKMNFLENTIKSLLVQMNLIKNM